MTTGALTPYAPHTPFHGSDSEDLLIEKVHAAAEAVLKERLGQYKKSLAEESIEAAAKNLAKGIARSEVSGDERELLAFAPNTHWERPQLSRG